MPTQQLQLNTGIAITPSDTFVYPRGVLIYVGVGGDVTITTLDDNIVTLGGVSGGTFLPVHAKRLMATGTTADRFVGNLLSSPVSDYFEGMPSFVTAKYSLAFDAAKADELNDYDVNTLYFRDKSFARVPATFSRTSSATRVNKHGLIETVATGVPRIDYSDGSAKLLMEPSRSNLLLRSEAFNNVYWSLSNASLTASFVSPDGLNGAFKFSDDNSNTGAQSIRLSTPNITVTNNVYYTASVFCKKDQLDWMYIWINNYDGSSDYRQWFDIANGVVGGTGGTGTANTFASIEDYGNGWYRCIATYLQGAADTDVQMYIQLASADNTLAAPTDGTSSIYIFGAQLEAGSYPTSYIPTAGSAVTRSADYAQISNAVSTFNETYAYVAGNTVGEHMRLWFIKEISTASGWGLKGDTVYERIGTITNRAINPTTEYGKIVIRAINNGEFSYWYNGNGKQIVTTNIGDLEAYDGTRIMINADQYSTLTYGYGYYDQILIFEDTALTDSECIQLTS